MGRAAKGWSLVWRRGVAHVRFTHEKKRYELSTGKKVEGEAVRRAAELYADVVSGRWRPVVGGSAALLVDLIPNWLDAFESENDEETAETYGGYAKRWPLFFGPTLGHVTHASGADYKRKRLREVTASSVRKELSALRGFLAWCVEQSLLETAPVIAGVPKKATGTRVGKARPKAIPLTPAQVESLLAALPEGLVRNRYTVMYETGLRPATISAISVPQSYSRGAAFLVVADEDDKNRYGRRIPLTRRARRALDASATCEGLVFGDHNHRHLWRKAVAAAGLPEGLVPYDLRHARFQHLVDAGQPLSGIAYLGGHLLITTLNQYVRASQRACEEMLFGGQTGVDEGAKEGSRTPTTLRSLEPEATDAQVNAGNPATGVRRRTLGNADIAKGRGSDPSRQVPPSWVHEATANLLGLLAGVQ
jgi:integrase